MKSRLVISFLLLLQMFSYAQKTVYGKVLDHENKPLFGATIYINNSSIGTTSDENGEFEIQIYGSNPRLVVTFLGYESEFLRITAASYGKTLVFKLQERVNKLDEVVIKAKISKYEYNKFMKEFVENFIGISKFASACRILNKEVIYFNYDKTTGTLEAYADEPLKIRNNELGYLIHYDLMFFQKNSEGVTYLGNSLFTDLKNGKKSVQQRWRQNRKRAYKGSLMHFLRSLSKNEHSKEGFVVFYNKLIENPKRPSDSILSLAEYSLKSLQSPSGERFTVDNLNLPTKITKPIKINVTNTVAEFKRKKDSLVSILRKSSLPRFKRKRLKNALREDFTVVKDGMLHLNFEPYIKVRYVDEEEEYSYPARNKRRSYQVSRLKLRNVEFTAIDSLGNLKNPLNLIVYEYMGFEKFGDALPINFKLK